MESIIDHKTGGHAMDHTDIYIKRGSNKKVRKTTKGWHFCIEWRDGTISWERLSYLKESNHVEVAEDVVSNNLLNAPPFVWWVPYMLKKRSRIIAAVIKRYHKRMHKFGFEVPKNWEDCVRL
jgi:DNA-dependent RNA polymerase auxiliary subunit epsilon